MKKWQILSLITLAVPFWALFGIAPLVAAGLISAGGSLIGSALAGKGASEAGKASAAATDKATQLQRDIWQQQRSDFAPWLSAGMTGLEDLQAMLQPGYDITTSPGYQFRFQQGLDALNNILSAKGMRDSGSALKAATEYGQNMGANEYNDQWNRLAQLAGMGSGPVQMQGQLANQYASNMGNLLMQGGANQANAINAQYTGAGNTLTNITDMAGNTMMLNNLMKMFQTQNPGTTNFMNKPQNALIAFPD